MAMTMRFSISLGMTTSCSVAATLMISGMSSALQVRRSGRAVGPNEASRLKAPPPWGVKMLDFSTWQWEYRT